MYEQSYPLSGLEPVVAVHRLLTSLRGLDPRNAVTLGSPPFERDDLNRIKAVRLRFTPKIDTPKIDTPKIDTPETDTLETDTLETQLQ